MVPRVRDDEDRLIPEGRSLERRVENWVEMVLTTISKPLSEEVEESWKWVGREYAERKLGIR